VLWGAILGRKTLGDKGQRRFTRAFVIADDRDAALLRWLNASQHSGDLSCSPILKAVDMIEAGLKMFESLRIEDVFQTQRISKNVIEKIRKSVPISTGKPEGLTVDRQGAAVVFLELGRACTATFQDAWDTGARGRNDDQNMVTLWFIRCMEYLRSTVMPVVREEGRPDWDKVVVVVDCQGAPSQLMTNRVKRCLTVLLSVGSGVYCGLLKHIYLVNMHPQQKPLWALFEKLLGPAVRDMVTITGKEDTHDTLLQHIDPLCLPESFGGRLPRDGLLDDFSDNLGQLVDCESELESPTYSPAKARARFHSLDAAEVVPPWLTTLHLLVSAPRWATCCVFRPKALGDVLDD